MMRCPDFSVCKCGYFTTAKQAVLICDMDMCMCSYMACTLDTSWDLILQTTETVVFITLVLHLTMCRNVTKCISISDV